MILVTGGAGFIGRNIVKELNRRGERALPFDNGSRASSGSRWDVRHFEDIYGVAQDCDCDEIIHCAYVNGTPNFYKKPDEVLDVGVKGICNLIQVCRALEIKKFTLLSSSEVCQGSFREDTPVGIPDVFNPRYSYSAGKIISEMMCIHSGNIFDRLLIVRPFNIYGPGMAPGHVIPDFCEQLFSKLHMPDPLAFEILGNGSETRSFCYIDDFVRGFMLVRDKGRHNEIYNIGTEEEVTIYELAQAMANIEHRGVPMVIREKGELREGDVKSRRPDIRKLRALGYAPKIRLAEGLRLTMEDYKCASLKNARFAEAAT